ncbi:hypothetical protein RHSIM_Rhsim06G0137000 [Rhododendron simsii]|uniref:Chaperone DnaJ C-terminal domain-containing protein n=1 Tax=Rhododendron simsii TaxID=118357 RepID=A0A834GQH6_RHOSS|nr:hypothetical protein RHSIM_Rhsim06G0137000 [Rhododendron simsii]
MDGGMRGRGSRFGSLFGDDMFTSFGRGGRGSIFGNPFGDDMFTSFGHGGGGSRFGSPFDDDVFTSFGYGGGGRPMHQSPGPRKAPSIEYRLPCSLEELYKGTTKKMKISREIADAIRTAAPTPTVGKSYGGTDDLPRVQLELPLDLGDMTISIDASNEEICGKSSGCSKTMLEEILTIDIKPGWKKGTKITFPEKGYEQPGVIPSDLIFIIDEKPHSVFTRDGNDLVVTEKIPLSEALTGHTVRQNTLDGRTLTIPINNVIHPDHEEVVRGEGMPIPKDPTKKGNLRIKFNVKFPARFNPEQKAGIKKLLTS